jgi:hypothetical protein
MNEFEFAALIKAAREIVTAEFSTPQPARFKELKASANSFLYRLFEDYGNGESHDAEQEATDDPAA